ncbi:SRPBCC domain-containing protein [Herbiconiux sp. VKM Ac-2851]|uniref:SRPBCC domain-containing protein n=1 Tax=Herbiconiux sp. VKM Ac-2851 TaxID=2739025 RepID=UPI0015651666|nr:SRPBCC domain-containing protein [Herbiconiux sp. VKM Ac-2851]NQX34578.1 SRPBCC domain-containing protein [Herbiconiux sp. VKM Ac-2851]
MTNPTIITAPEGLPFIEIVREFDAPVAAVYAAYADPLLVAQWLGPDGYDVDLESYDLVSGGHYRYLHTNPAGDVFAFRGSFHTVRPEELIIQTFEWEGMPDSVSLETIRFTSGAAGAARAVIRGWSVFPSVEARDGMVQNGMERGVVEGYGRLDALLAP